MFAQLELNNLSDCLGHQLTFLHSNVTARPKPATRNFKGDEKMPIAKLHYVRLSPAVLVVLFCFSRNAWSTVLNAYHCFPFPGVCCELLDC